MKASLEKNSTSIIDAFIKEPSKIDSGTIRLKLVQDKKNSYIVSELPYRKNIMHYEFNMSRKEPKSIGDFDYILEVVGDNGDTEETRKMKLFRGAPHHISGAVKKIRNDFRVVAKTHNGSIVYLFKRLPSDEHCPSCWDNDLMASSNTSCSVCGGTGFIRIYSKPYKTYGSSVNFTNEKYGTQDQGKTMEDTSVVLSTVADFVLTTDDILFYAKTGDFYRVKARTISELQTYPVLQRLILDLMPSDSPEVETAKKILEQETKK